MLVRTTPLHRCNPLSEVAQRILEDVQMHYHNASSTRFVCDISCLKIYTIFRTVVVHLLPPPSAYTTLSASSFSLTNTYVSPLSHAWTQMQKITVGWSVCLVHAESRNTEILTDHSAKTWKQCKSQKSVPIKYAHKNRYESVEADMLQLFFNTFFFNLMDHNKHEMFRRPLSISTRQTSV